MEKELTIGHAARLSGVPVDTIRFYERKGLIQAPLRNSSGYRVYPTKVIEQIQFIKDGRDLQFSLEEIGKLMSLLYMQEKNCDGIQQLLETKIEQINREIGQLVAANQRLKQLRGDCNCTEEQPDCPLADAPWSQK